MPWGYVAGYYLYGKSKKRQQKPAPLNASQQSILDFLNASKTTTLSDKDTSLLVSTDTIQYGSEQDNYLGPPFGTSDDYVEVYAQHNHGSIRNVIGDSTTECFFGGFRVTGA